MRLLLDSHVALWWLSAYPALGSECTAAIQSADEVQFSPVTPWELGIKKALGKLSFPDGLTGALATSGFEELPISSAHAELAASLPALHRDPFDRMLIAQAISEQLTLVTADRLLGGYEVSVLNATA